MSRTALAEEIAGFLDAVVTGAPVRGVQASVILADSGEEIHLACGEAHDGSVLRTDMLYWGYCLARPVVTTGLVALMENQGARLSDPLLPDPAWSKVSFVDLLNHNAGLGEPTYVDWKLADRRGRGNLAAGIEPSDRAEYGTIASAVGLRAIHSRLAPGEPPLEEWILDHLLTPLGLADDLVVAPARQSSTWHNRLYSTEEVDPATGQPTPLLSELLEAQVHADVGIEGGLLANARGMSRFAAATLRVARGELAPGMPSPVAIRQMLATGGRPRWDHQLGKICRFAGGFMADLAQFEIASTGSELALGHSGGLSSSCFLFDRLTGVALAVTITTITEPRASARFRMHLVDGLLRLATGQRAL